MSYEFAAAEQTQIEQRGQIYFCLKINMSPFSSLFRPFRGEWK